MCQNAMQSTPGGGCNDYSRLTTNTGIATISSANANLNGTDSVDVIMGVGNGTFIRSVTIKAAAPVDHNGIVRLFIYDGVSQYSLYKEVSVPITPVLGATPSPALPLQAFEVVLVGGIMLNAGYKLTASTQYADTFNIIAEGVNLSYPSPLPSTCCNFKQEMANIGIGTISAANTNLDGSGTIVTLVRANNAANGTTINAVTIKATGSTTSGMVRLFISSDGNTFYLWREVPVPFTTQSGTLPSFKQVINMNFYLQPGYYLGASTQKAENFAVTVDATSWTYP